MTYKWAAFVPFALNLEPSPKSHTDSLIVSLVSAEKVVVTPGNAKRGTISKSKPGVTFNGIPMQRRFLFPILKVNLPPRAVRGSTNLAAAISKERGRFDVKTDACLLTL